VRPVLWALPGTRSRLRSPGIRQESKGVVTQAIAFENSCGSCHLGKHPLTLDMAAAPYELHEVHPPTPAPAELAERAALLVRKYPECFWFWHPDARVRSLEDLRRVIQHLREYGDRSAWWAAQELHQCLSPLYKKTC
jgi:hypothetical protein